MVKRTIQSLLAICPIWTRTGLVIKRVELTFLPPMTLITVVMVWACILIVHNEFGCLPVGTGGRVIVAKVGLPPKVLVVMGVNAKASVVGD